VAKPIKSTDKRKKEIMEAFKVVFNVTKVTSVKEDSLNFYATCHRRLDGNVRGFENLGNQTLLKRDFQILINK